MQEHLPLEPVLMPAAQAATGSSGALQMVTGLAIAVGVGIGSWFGFAPPLDPVPQLQKAYSDADFGVGLVTRLDAADPASLDRALSAIEIPSAERDRLREQLLEGKLRIGLIGFWDDVAADGDTVVVTGAGVRQTVVLSHNLTPVVTPYVPGSTILVTAVHDGGGSVTVAVMTRNGPVHLRRLLVGESIEVPAP